MAKGATGTVSSTDRNWIRDRLEYALAWSILKPLGVLPRNLARFLGRLFGGAAYRIHRRLRETAGRNLEMAFPGSSAEDRQRIIRGVFRNMGNLLGEVSQFPGLTRRKVERFVVYDGYENYERAAQKGRGVLFLTGHFGAWELCAFAHGAFGNKLNFLVRRLDNPLLDRLVNDYRCASGNSTIDKNNSVREVVKALRDKEAVGFLIDINTVADQGIFCDFFGMPACTSSGLAVLALRTRAPVVPGFLLWDGKAGKYRLKFEPEVELTRTGDFREEVQINTSKFTRIIEDYARCYPEQWLWVHRRWKTRPPGEPDLYQRKSNEAVSRAVKVEADLKAGSPRGSVASD